MTIIRETPLGDAGAVFSDCFRYRYLLWRRWDASKPSATIVMLNPSVATEEVNDPTIRSCIRLFRNMGHGGFEVVNLMAWRATNPKELPSKPSDAMGPNNPHIIEAAVSRCDLIICAWGAHPYAAHFAPGLLDIVRMYRPTAYCFGKTKTGAPKHPLYIKSGTALEAYGI